MPLIAIDFSLGNLTFTDNTCMHSTNPTKPNNYRDLLYMISESYANILNLPIFGYGARTSTFTNKTSSLFPISRSIRNPFTPNDPSVLDQTYSDCLSTLELSVPVNINPLMTFLKSIGLQVKQRLSRKAAHNHAIRDTVDSFYVLYVLSTGIIDDVAEVIKTVSQSEWSSLPI